MGRGGNTGVRSGQQAQQASTRLLCLRCSRCSGPLPEQSKLLAGEQELNKQICGNCYNHEYDGFVFVDELGERMRVEYLTNAFPKFLESHGLRRMRFHDLRHSCASLLLANARSPQTHSGVVGAQRYRHDGEYLQPFGLQVQDHLGTGNGDRACSTGGRRLRKSVEGGLSRKSGEKNKSLL